MNIFARVGTHQITYCMEHEWTSSLFLSCDSTKYWNNFLVCCPPNYKFLKYYSILFGTGNTCFFFNIPFPGGSISALGTNHLGFLQVTSYKCVSLHWKKKKCQQKASSIYASLYLEICYRRISKENHLYYVPYIQINP